MGKLRCRHIGRQCRMADMAGRALFRSAAGMFFEKLSETFILSPGAVVTGSATADGHRSILVLQRLIIVRGFAGRNHGMGALVAGGAIEATVACIIPI